MKKPNDNVVAMRRKGAHNLKRKRIQRICRYNRFIEDMKAANAMLKKSSVGLKLKSRKSA